MAKGTRICKICGKEYPYCRTSRPGNVFRWQDVCCSEAHGQEYFARVLASRAKTETVEDEADTVENEADTVTEDTSVDVVEESVEDDVTDDEELDALVEEVEEALEEELEADGESDEI